MNKFKVGDILKVKIPHSNALKSSEVIVVSKEEWTKATGFELLSNIPDIILFKVLSGPLAGNYYNDDSDNYEYSPIQVIKNEFNKDLEDIINE